MKPSPADAESSRPAPRHRPAAPGKQGVTAPENHRTESLHKYHSSFNSASDNGRAGERNRCPIADYDSSPPESGHPHNLSIERRASELPRVPSRSPPPKPSHSRPDLHSADFLSDAPPHSPDTRPDAKKKPSDRPVVNASLNSSHIDDYVRNHPMKITTQTTLERTFKVLDRTGATHINHFMKQKMSLLKNMETKLHRHEAPSAKNLLPLPSKPEKYSRASTRQKLQHSASRNRRPVPAFNPIYRPDEPPLKPERKGSGMGGLGGAGAADPRKKAKGGEFEFNHVFKILDFLDKDKTLKQGRRKLQEKMKDLGRESFNESARKASQLEQLSEDNFRSEFVIKGVLGKGSYGEVKLCVSVSTGQPFAVKIYPRKFLKDEIKRQNLRNESEILEQMDHENIIRLFQVVEGPRHIYLLTEYGGRSSLHETLTSSAQNVLTEDEARPLIWQLVQALRYLHSRGVVHRDVKLHNVLVTDQGKVKLIDFGFALRMDPHELIKVFCGTPSYMAPEIVARTPYDGRPADIWALGVCIYRMIVGCFPFRGDFISLHRRRTLQTHPGMPPRRPRRRLARVRRPHRPSLPRRAARATDGGGGAAGALLRLAAPPRAVAVRRTEGVGPPPDHRPLEPPRQPALQLIEEAATAGGGGNGYDWTSSPGVARKTWGREVELRRSVVRIRKVFLRRTARRRRQATSARVSPPMKQRTRVGSWMKSERETSAAKLNLTLGRAGSLTRRFSTILTETGVKRA